MFWPVEQAAEVLSAYREFLPGAPRELYGFFALQTVPPADPFPSELRLRKVCGVCGAISAARTRPLGRWPRCSTHCRSR